MKTKCYFINETTRDQENETKNESDDGEKMKFDDSIYVSNKYRINRARNKNQISQVEREKCEWRAEETTTKLMN